MRGRLGGDGSGGGCPCRPWQRVGEVLWGHAVLCKVWERFGSEKKGNGETLYSVCSLDVLWFLSCSAFFPCLVYIRLWRSLCTVYVF